MALLPAPFGPWIKLMFGPKSTRSNLRGGRREQRARAVDGSMAADAAFQSRRRATLISPPGLLRVIHEVDEAEALDNARLGRPILNDK